MSKLQIAYDKAGNFILPRVRHLVQLAMIGIIGKWSFYGIFRCPFMVPFINCQTCPVITCWGRLTTYFWSVWLIIPLLTIFLGRAFCSWICPVGSVNQLLGKFAAWKLRIPAAWLRWSAWGKLIALAVALYLFFALDNYRALPPIRTGEFLSSIMLNFQNATLPWIVRSSVVICLILFSLVIANFWCRFGCPMGGVLEIFRKFSIFKVYKTFACDNCNACLRKCEMGTRPAEANCTNCGDCLNTCHKDAIKFGRHHT